MEATKSASPQRKLFVGLILVATILLLVTQASCQEARPASPITRALITRQRAAAAGNERQLQSQKRDLGMIAIKALLLGPLIGLTIKAALVRGLVWALVAYGLHLFFPALLSSLGLGSGLVGFARQLRPDYSQVLANYLGNLQLPMPNSLSQVTKQYRQVLGPLVESIRSIPEGHCRYRAVCETASHLVRQARSVSTTLQRISATVYMNFGTDYSKAWLDGIVQSDCAAKYAQCQASPFSMVAARLAQSLGVGQQQVAAVQQTAPLFAPQQQALASAAASGGGVAAAPAAALQQALAQTPA